jgi:hypothetical protein
MCFNKLLHTTGYLCNISLIPKLWLSGIMSQYFQPIPWYIWAISLNNICFSGLSLFGVW